MRQALTRMQASFEDADFDVDCLCASVQKPGHVESLIIVASPQTLARRLDDLPRIDMVIIDECHRVPPKDQGSLYRDVIEAVITRRPNARIVGITATPWRLGQTYIYGPAASEGSVTWWDSLDVHISIAHLQEQGWLCPLTALACEPDEDLAQLPVGASGDFREDALEETLLKPLHLGSAVKAIETHAKERRHIAVFCVSIAHARALARRFCEAGFAACAIDSKAGQQTNLEVLQDFANGRVQVLCSVGMLTEGWDCPQTDCLLMCRPTLSPALYVQMVGRGLRIAEGKTDCLLLDLSGNIYRHGSPNAPRIRLGGQLVGDISGFSSRNDDEKGDETRRCPYCEGILPDVSVLRCPQCQAPFYDFEEKGKSFRAIDLARLEKLTLKGEAVRQKRLQEDARLKAEEKAQKEEAARERAEIRQGLINQGKPVTATVVTYGSPQPWQIRTGPAKGAQVLKFDLTLQIAGYGRRLLQVILDPEGAMGRKSRTTWWAHTQTREFWSLCGQGTFPGTKAGIVARWAFVRIPPELVVKQTMGGFLQVIWNPSKPGKTDKAQKAEKSGAGRKTAKKEG